MKANHTISINQKIWAEISKDSPNMSKLIEDLLTNYLAQSQNRHKLMEEHREKVKQLERLDENSKILASERIISDLSEEELGFLIRRKGVYRALDQKAFNELRGEYQKPTLISSEYIYIINRLQELIKDGILVPKEAI